MEKEYNRSPQEVLEELGSCPTGLTEAEAAERLAKHGPNKLKEAEKPSLLQRFLAQLKDPMLLILMAAAAVSAVTNALSGESFTEVFIILVVVLLNAVLGVVQESKAEAAIEALQTMTAAKCKVLRDGHQVVIESSQLVPGDVVLLEAGDAVPADGRLLESASMKIEEAALTGESVPVTKAVGLLTGDNVPLGDRKNMCYMGSTVVYGRGKAVITATGMDTEMGKIAGVLAQTEQEQTPLQRKLNELGKTMSKLVLGICVFIFIFDLVVAGEFTLETVLSTFMVAVSLAVAAIPEGLATVVTVVLSIGVTNMSKQHAVIRRLTAGMAVLLLDGCAKGIAFSVQSLNARSVDEPAGEGNLRGSREGFADLLRVNTSLLRRCFRNDALVIEIGQADCEMKTEYALCYCRDTADPKAVQKVRQTLQRAGPQLLLDSSYFVPWLFPCKIRTFAPVRYTERPIVAAAKLREGKFVILVNGSPSALILPTLFCENFECLDDYAGTAYFASFLRMLKYTSFYLSIFLPGVFVCWAVYLPELLPPQLLFKIEAAEQATPLPLFGEMLLVILMLEIIREAGLRMPQTLGHSVSLIAALIIGDAAIAAGLMSTPVILTAAAASIAVFVTPSLYEVATVLRLVVLLAAGVAGPVGLAACALGVLFGLTRVSALGVPYLRDVIFPEVPLSPDGVTRRSYPKLSRRPFTIWQKRGG